MLGCGPEDDSGDSVSVGANNVDGDRSGVIVILARRGNQAHDDVNKD